MRDPTEGVNPQDMRLPYLKRNMPKLLESEEEYADYYGGPQWNEDELVLRITPNNYHILYDPGTSDWWVHNFHVTKRGLSAYEELKRERAEKFDQLFGEKGEIFAAMEGVDHAKASEEYRRWIQDGPVVEAGSESDGKSNGDAIDAANDDGDEVMAGA